MLKTMNGIHARGGTTGNKGQVAIFVALIFQVLFVFFTMVVNVGLLVHHKINLQNSVDLAAYYGAMKQAQVLNALAHVNYQIRQSWKLATFRYRQIGMAGDDSVHPFDTANKTLRASASVDGPLQAPTGGACPTTFCMSYSPVKGFQDSEVYCKDICKTQTITLLGRPQGSGMIAGLFQFPGIVQATDNISIQLAKNSVETCDKSTVLNWFNVARFIWGYKSDLINRKRIFNKLANSISYSTGDLKDIEGQSTKQGAYLTFFKNLSYPNQVGFDEASGSKGDGFSFTFFNSMGANGCSGTEGDEKSPPRWAKEVFVKPVYMFRNGDCNKDAQPLLNLENINYFSAPVNLGGQIFSPKALEGSVIPTNVVNFLKEVIVDPDDLGSPDVRLSHSTAGYEKNPWCMSYIAVQASASPKIPFTPFNRVRLVARGFAKPFGGRMGPWYYKTWPAGSPASVGGPDDKIDKMLPPRFEVGVNLSDANDEQLKSDASRYVGDVVGTKSTMTMGQFGRAIHRLYSAPQSLDTAIWNGLLGSDSDVSSLASNGDSLAILNGATVPMRNLELAAVIPDQFDISYYSIEPDFWRNYAAALKKRPEFSALQIRGDLGFRRTGEARMASMTVIDQLRTVHDNFVSGGSGVLDLINTLSYTAGLANAKDGFVELLTSWHMKGLGDYELDRNRFGKCPPSGIIADGPNDPLPATTGNCGAGGRTGYSVKLVDGEFLKSNQPLGGVGTTGQILNVWDESSFQ
jgi:hypothetical protein